MPESEYEWVPDPKWKVIAAGGECSYPRCPNEAVVLMFRRRTGNRESRHRYCPDHLYGRRIIDGVVQIQRRKPHA